MNRTALLSITLSVALSACGGGGGSGDAQPSSTADTSKPMLNWVPPSTRTDNSFLDLSEIQGYKIYGGPSSYNLELLADLDDSQITSYDLTGMEPGEYYFGIVVYDILGLQSQISNRILKVIP
ncbi:MAG: fibronectin type III domain-containing protein [Candidatus Thiodiazotropha sp.]